METLPPVHEIVLYWIFDRRRKPADFIYYQNLEIELLNYKCEIAKLRRKFQCQERSFKDALCYLSGGTLNFPTQSQDDVNNNNQKKLNPKIYKCKLSIENEPVSMDILGINNTLKETFQTPRNSPIISSSIIPKNMPIIPKKSIVPRVNSPNRKSNNDDSLKKLNKRGRQIETSKSDINSIILENKPIIPKKPTNPNLEIILKVNSLIRKTKNDDDSLRQINKGGRQKVKSLSTNDNTFSDSLADDIDTLIPINDLPLPVEENTDEISIQTRVVNYIRSQNIMVRKLYSKCCSLGYPCRFESVIKTYQLKTGFFSKRCKEIISKNWNEIKTKFNIIDIYEFVTGLRYNQKMIIVLYMSQNLPYFRFLIQILKNWIKIVDNKEFTEDENAIILSEVQYKKSSNQTYLNKKTAHKLKRLSEETINAQYNLLSNVSRDRKIWTAAEDKILLDKLSQIIDISKAEKQPLEVFYPLVEPNGRTASSLFRRWDFLREIIKSYSMGVLHKQWIFTMLEEVKQQNGTELIGIK